MPSNASIPRSRAYGGRRSRTHLVAPVVVVAGLLWLGCTDWLPTAPQGTDERTGRDPAPVAADVLEAPGDSDGLSTVCRAMKRHLDQVRAEIDAGAATSSTLQALASDLAKAMADTCE